MERLTYKQAYDKIIEAYFKDEIRPCLPAFCFCGTLNDGKIYYWRNWRIKDDGEYYEGIELQAMEDALFIEFEKHFELSRMDLAPAFGELIFDPQYENVLFAGMCAALDVLKQIHKERGEDVDEELKLTKRNLIPA